MRFLLASVLSGLLMISCKSYNSELRENKAANQEKLWADHADGKIHHINESRKVDDIINSNKTSLLIATSKTCRPCLIFEKTGIPAAIAKANTGKSAVLMVDFIAMQKDKKGRQLLDDMAAPATPHAVVCAHGLPVKRITEDSKQAFEKALAAAERLSREQALVEHQKLQSWYAGTLERNSGLKRHSANDK